MTLWRGSRLGDRFEVVTRGDVILEDAEGGDDTVLSHADGYVLSANLENLVLAADAGAAFGVGNALANRILGNDAANLLIGGAGEDSLAGGAGDDRLFGEAGDDSLLGGLGQDWAYGGDGADSLQGGQGDDTLLGEAGDDLLHGGAGRDWLDGGAGNDLYLVDDSTDIVVERADGGSDTVAVGIAGGGWYLAGEIEAMLLLDGTRFGVGNALGNTVLGNAGDNLLLGGLGDDDLRGEAGRDSLFGEAGADTLRGGDDADFLLGGGEADSLGGDAGSDTLLGEAGADRLDGGEGADWAFGGGEDDSLSGGAGADWLDGGEGADSLAGGLDADTLLGGAGTDTLDGGAGADWMLGGADSDLYRVDDPGDVVLDTGTTGWDVAAVDIAGGGFALGAASGIEALDLLGTTRFGVGDAAANRITGNAVANLLIGGGGADTIRGGDGHDSLFGGAGADTFLFGQYASYGGGLADRGTDLIADYETADSVQFAGVSVVLTWLTAGAVQATFRVGGAWQADSVLLQGDFSDPAALHLGALSVWDGSLLIDTRAVPGFVPEGTLYARGGVYLTGAAAGGGVIALLAPDPGGNPGVVVTSLRPSFIPASPLAPPELDRPAILATLATLTDLDGTGALALPAPATDQPFA